VRLERESNIGTIVQSREKLGDGILYTVS